MILLWWQQFNPPEYCRALQVWVHLREQITRRRGDTILDELVAVYTTRFTQPSSQACITHARNRADCGKGQLQWSMGTVICKGLGGTHSCDENDGFIRERIETVVIFGESDKALVITTVRTPPTTEFDNTVTLEGSWMPGQCSASDPQVPIFLSVTPSWFTTSV